MVKSVWTIRVTNIGVDTAVNVKVTDKLPEGVRYVSDDSLNNYDSESGIWTIGDLASGESIELNIVTKVVKTNVTINNFAKVTSDTYDTNETNNVCNNSTTVPPEADLEISVETSADEVVVGDNVEIRVTVVNNGPDTAENTRASVKLPKGLDLSGFKPSKGTYDPETGIWDIGDLAPGEEATLIITAKALTSGKVVIEANVTCDTYESDLSNNNASAEINVTEAPSKESMPPASETPKMHATGNPIAMIVLALIVLAGAGIRRKD